MLSLTWDLSDLKSLFELPKLAKQAMQEGARDLSAMGHAKTIELAAQRLKSRRSLFVENLKIFQEDQVWVLELQKPAAWIEDGLPPHDMLDYLLKSPKAKTGKNGKWIAIPFVHNKAPQNTPESAKPMVDAIRQRMKRDGIAWGKIEKDAEGKPLLGTLHRFSINDRPLKTGFGPGQGHGPVGDVRQGMNMRQREGGGPGGGGIPFLRNVSIRQREVKGKVERSVLTFRIASESQRGTGMWHSPGVKGAKIFESVFQWMADAFEKDIAPSIMAKLEVGA